MTQRSLAMALMLMNIGGGARAVTVKDRCSHCRSFFAPAQTYRVIAKAVTRQPWRRAGKQHTFGQDRARFQAHDVESLRGQSRLAVAPASVPSPITIDAKTPRAGPAVDFRLPTDLSPVKPPHLLL